MLNGMPKTTMNIEYNHYWPALYNPKYPTGRNFSTICHFSKKGQPLLLSGYLTHSRNVLRTVKTGLYTT